MERAYDGTTIPHDTEVYGADGEQVGTVIAGSARHIVVAKGLFFPTDYYIPTDAIARYDDGRVILSVTKDEALASGWDTPPVDDSYLAPPAVAAPEYDASGSAVAAAERAATGRHAHMGESATSPGLAGDLTRQRDGPRERAPGSRSAADPVVADDGATIRLHAEELVPRIQRRLLGDVRLAKNVVDEERSLEVPLVDEQLTVTWRRIERDPETGERVVAEQSFTVPLSREEVELERRARVVEEVVIRKEATERIERVAGTVRTERLTVDGEPLADE